MNSTPARRREASLWGLHHHVGYGFRQWQRRSGAPDKEVFDIGRVAVESIKDLIWTSGTLETTSVFLHRFTGSRRRNRKRAQWKTTAYATDGFVDGLSGTAPDDEDDGGFHRLDFSSQAARGVQNTAALEQHALQVNCFIDSARCNVADPLCSQSADTHVFASFSGGDLTGGLPLDRKRERKLQFHLSDTSTVSMVSTAATWGETNISSTSADEVEGSAGERDGQVPGGRQHARRPRRNRRQKARIRRDEYIAAQCSELRQHSSAEDASFQLLGALLEGLDEDGDGDVGDGWGDMRKRRLGDLTPSVSSTSSLEGDSEMPAGTSGDPLDTMPMAPKVTEDGGFPSSVFAPIELDALVPESDDSPVHKRARCDSDRASACSESSRGSSLSDSATDGDDTPANLSNLTGPALLEGLEKGAQLLPEGLVGAMVRLQEANFSEMHAHPQDSLGASFATTAATLRKRLKRVQREASGLESCGDHPRAITDIWTELYDWIFDGDDGPSYQLRRIQDLLEETTDRPFDEEWLRDEIGHRHWSLCRGWEHFEMVLENLEKASEREAWRIEQRRGDAACLQATLNARAAWSLCNWPGVGM